MISVTQIREIGCIGGTIARTPFSRSVAFLLWLVMLVWLKDGGTTCVNLLHSRCRKCRFVKGPSAKNRTLCTRPFLPLPCVFLSPRRDLYRNGSTLNETMPVCRQRARPPHRTLALRMMLVMHFSHLVLLPLPPPPPHPPKRSCAYRSSAPETTLRSTLQLPAVST